MKSVSRLLLVLLCLAALVEGTSAPRAEAGGLSGAEITKRVVGNTVTWSTNGDRFAEYYRPDGVVLGQENETPFSALWWIERDLMCFDYARSGCVCWRVAVEGDTVDWMRSDQTLTTKLLEGNALNLPAPPQRPQATCSAVSVSASSTDPRASNRPAAQDEGR
jgi:hypothetical protein